MGSHTEHLHLFVDLRASLGWSARDVDPYVECRWFCLVESDRNKSVIYRVGSRGQGIQRHQSGDGSIPRELDAVQREPDPHSHDVHRRSWRHVGSRLATGASPRERRRASIRSSSFTRHNECQFDHLCGLAQQRPDDRGTERGMYTFCRRRYDMGCSDRSGRYKLSA